MRLDALLSHHAQNFRKVSKFTTILVINCFIFIILLIVLEGTIGWLQFIRNVWKTVVVAEQIHTAYDPLLGWVNSPNFIKNNMYGANNNLHILSNGTRLTSDGPHPYQKTVICSGDSFTFGYGVDDRETWCALLGKNNWQMINMGVGGYGMDQSMLHYEQSARSTPHQIHIAAFNIYDFDRIFLNLFLGYGKPYFQVNGKSIVNTQYPVLKQSHFMRFFAIHKQAFENLHVFQVAKALHDPVKRTTSINDQQSIVNYIVERLKNSTQNNNAIFIFVLLPTIEDKYERDTYLQKKKQIQELAQKYSFLVVDVGEKMFNLDSAQYNALFIPRGAMTYHYAEGHYSEVGNIFVAAVIQEAIDAFFNSD